jgi:YVTN family beta-propeller protein
MKFLSVFFVTALILGLSIGSSEPIHLPASTDGDPDIITIKTKSGQTINDFIGNPSFQLQYSQTDVDPGIAPEGDYMGCACFTRDGSRVLLTNRGTDNITVFNWSTMGVITNIPVGDYPWGIAVTDSYAVVACGFGDEIYVIKLSDYSIAHVFTLPAGQQPWVVRVNASGTRAYVACDISNTCEVFNLQTMNHDLTISNFPIALMTYSWNSENGRNAFTFTNFEVTPDGNYLISSGYQDSLYFINASTGSVDYVVPNILDIAAVGISLDGSKTVALSNLNPGVLYQIDNTTHAVTGTVTLTGYQFMTYEVGVNATGTKAYVGVSNNRSAIARFATSDFVTFTQTYTAFWIGTSPNRAYAISGQYNFSIVDFASETVVGQSIGNSQSCGAVSPSGNRVVGFDPHRHEGLYFYDYTTPSAPSYRGTTIAGLNPEGDCPRRVAITPNGTKAVVAEVLSDNATIVNMSTYSVEATLNIGDRPQDIAITSDSRWAVVCGMNSNCAAVIDLQTNTVAASVATGSGSAVVCIAPDDSFAYVGNVGANTVSVIRLAGAASVKVADIPCGEIGVVWACYGVSSGINIDPTGSYVLVAVSFDDQVKVISTVTNTVVATITVGDFPIEVDFDSTGKYATVTNAFSDNYSIIYVNGSSSSLVGTFPNGDYPLRLDYNKTTDEIGIGNYNSKTVVNIDPRTGAVHSTNSYASYGNIYQVIFDEIGGPIVLTGPVGNLPGHIHRGTDIIQLPASPAYFDYCPAAHKAAVAMPGPDILTVIDWGGTGVEQVVNIPLSLQEPILNVSPNPFNQQIIIKFQIPNSKYQTNSKFQNSIRIYNASGRMVKSFNHLTIQPINQVIWDGTDNNGSQALAGVYFVVAQSGDHTAVQKIMLVR